jgi:putative ABC transport system permease protein
MTVLLDAWGNDIRQAVRRITHTPGLSAVVITTLALAIAANTTIFSLLKPTVLRTLDAPEPSRLVSIDATDAKTANYVAIPVVTKSALDSDTRAFAILGAYSSGVVRLEYSGGGGFDVGVEGVTPEYFDILGVQAREGRLFTTQDDLYGAIGIITERLRARLFGTGSAVGQTIIADGRPLEIVGVFAGDFAGVRLDGGSDVILPLAFLRSTLVNSDPKGGLRAQQLIARLAPDATEESARAEVVGRWPGIRAAIVPGLPAPQQTPVTNAVLSVKPFAHGFSGTRDRYGSSLMMVMMLALALLAVGSVNLCGLMLARALTRQHEFAVRIALGVSRARLFQQTLIDGVLLSLAALVIAMPLAWWASTILTAMVSMSRAVPIGNTTPDGEVVATALAVAIVIGILIGLLPAQRAIALPTDDILRGRGTSQRIRGSARALLITQVALSMILVVGAGLFMTTLSNLYQNDVQDRPHPVLFTRLARLPLERGKPLPPTYFQNLQEQLAAVPGVDRAAMSDIYPAYFSYFLGALPTDTLTLNGGAQATAIVDHVTPGFFDLYSIGRLRGRDFTWQDAQDGPAVVIVNEALASRLSPGLDVVGQRVEIKSGPSKTSAEIVGVVANSTVSTIRERNVAGYYRPLMQMPRRTQTPMVHVRVTGDVATAQRAYVDVINGGRQHFVRGMFNMDSWVGNAVVEQQLIAGMAGVAATMAMFIAAVGLFGLLAYSVSSRIREIGVRISVGATASEVVSMIVREGLAVVLPGIAIGIPLALGAAWLVRSQLYGVTATDPRTLVIAAVVFIAVAAFASWLPARRASKIQPIEALRQE